VYASIPCTKILAVLPVQKRLSREKKEVQGGMTLPNIKHPCCVTSTSGLMDGPQTTIVTQRLYLLPRRTED
jgi:hypothetical protein